MGSPEALRTYGNKEILNRTKFIGWPRSIDIKKGWYGNNGYQMIAKPEVSTAINRKKIVPSGPARHETKHGFPNPDNVKMITIVPGPGYLGLTELYKPDPIAALAPHATGEDGTGHDVMIASFMTGDINSAGNVAKSIVQNNTEEIEEVASILEEKRTMTGHEFKQAVNSVRDKEEVQKATVFVKTPDGSEKSVPNLNVKNGAVILPPKEQVIPSQHYELPKEGTIFSRN